MVVQRLGDRRHGGGGAGAGPGVLEGEGGAETFAAEVWCRVSLGGSSSGTEIEGCGCGGCCVETHGCGC